MLKKIFEIIAFLAISISGVASGYKWFFGEARVMEIAHCGEPLTLTDCQVENWTAPVPSCLLTNKSEVTFRASVFKIWPYGKDGIQLGSRGYLDASDLGPGQRRRIELRTSEFGKAGRLVVCSMNPDSPYARDRVKVVATVR